jgi:8-oxo-dGTP diphosphatase
MKLFYATSNEGKVYNLKRITRNLSLDILTPKDFGVFLDVIEDGQTTIENAIKKAKAYYELVKMPTMAGDTALYISGLPENKQPGTHIRRVNGKELSGEELVSYYAELMDFYGGSCEAWNMTGIALATEKGVSAVEIEESKALLTSIRSVSREYKISPLDAITIDLVSNKYYCEMTDNELDVVSRKYDTEVVGFLKKYLLQNSNI